MCEAAHLDLDAGFASGNIRGETDVFDNVLPAEQQRKANIDLYQKIRSDPKYKRRGPPLKTMPGLIFQTCFAIFVLAKLFFS